MDAEINKIPWEVVAQPRSFFRFEDDLWYAMLQIIRQSYVVLEYNNCGKVVRKGMPSGPNVGSSTRHLTSRYFLLSWYSDNKYV